jgi:hypothetical protein
VAGGAVIYVALAAQLAGGHTSTDDRSPGACRDCWDSLSSCKHSLVMALVGVSSAGYLSSVIFPLTYPNVG